MVQAEALVLSLRCYRIPFSTKVERVSLAAGYEGLEIDRIDVEVVRVDARPRG